MSPLYINGHTHNWHRLFRFSSMTRVPYISAEVSTSHNREFKVIVGIVNTAANMSLLTFRTAKVLGIDKPKRGQKTRLRTLTGRTVTCYIHPLRIRVMDDVRKIYYEFILCAGFAHKISTDQFGMDWTLNFCLAFDQQSVSLLRE
jgi:hypothetical protein